MRDEEETRAYAEHAANDLIERVRDANMQVSLRTGEPSRVSDYTYVQAKVEVEVALLRAAGLKYKSPNERGGERG